MIFENRLSASFVISTIPGSRGATVTDIYDFEDGGIALGDASQGLQYQTWEGKLNNDTIYLRSNTTPWTIILSDTKISEFSFTFDQNMKPTISYIQDNNAKLYWYDSTIENYKTTSLEAFIRTPKVLLDDKRKTQIDSGNSDIILAYLKENKLYYRQQRDRYETEYFLADLDILFAHLYAGEKVWRLIKFGMNDKLRLQFLFRYTKK